MDRPTFEARRCAWSKAGELRNFSCGRDCSRSFREGYCSSSRRSAGLGASEYIAGVSHNVSRCSSKAECQGLLHHPGIPHPQLPLALGREGPALAIVLDRIRRCVTTIRNLQSATNMASFFDLLHGSKDSTYLDFGFEFDRHSMGIVGEPD